MKKPVITYRQYKPADKKEFIRCLEDVQDYFITQDEVGWMRRSPDFGKKYADYLLKDMKKLSGRILLALDGKRVVGLILGSVERPKGFDRIYTRLDEKLGWIYLLYVDPKYRGMRISSELFDRLELYFKEKKCTVVRLEAQGNMPMLVEMYAKRGYRPWLMNMAKRISSPTTRKRA